MIDHSRSLAAQRLVRTFMVIKPEILIQSEIEFRDGLIIFYINIFILDATPQAFNKNIVQGPATAVHTDFNLFCR